MVCILLTGIQQDLTPLSWGNWWDYFRAKKLLLARFSCMWPTESRDVSVDVHVLQLVLYTYIGSHIQLF